MENEMRVNKRNTKEMKPTRVLIANSHPAVCSALKLLLGEEPGLEVLGEVSNSKDLLPQAEKLLPDLVLLDWGLTGSRAVELISGLHAGRRQVTVIALSSRPEKRQAAISSGADMFVSEGDPPEVLMGAINRLRKPGNNKQHVEIEGGK